MIIDHFYDQLEFSHLKDERPFIALNMVSSIDGKITSGGKLQPGSLGSAFDRYTMNVIRSHFDAILAGGNTIRDHPFYLGVPPELENQRSSKGLAPQPLTILMTKSGKLDPNTPLFKNPPRPPIIITTTQGAQALPKLIKEQSTIEIFREDESLESVIKLLLTKYHVKRLLVEGGPNINYQFLKAKLFDELFLTLAPHLVGATADLTMVMGEGVLRKPAQITLLSALPHNNELYLRYKITW